MTNIKPLLSDKETELNAEAQLTVDELTERIADLGYENNMNPIQIFNLIHRIIHEGPLARIDDMELNLSPLQISSLNTEAKEILAILSINKETRHAILKEVEKAFKPSQKTHEDIENLNERIPFFPIFEKVMRSLEFSDEEVNRMCKDLKKSLNPQEGSKFLGKVDELPITEITYLYRAALERRLISTKVHLRNGDVSLMTFLALELSLVLSEEIQQPTAYIRIVQKKMRYSRSKKKSESVLLKCQKTFSKFYPNIK